MVIDAVMVTEEGVAATAVTNPEEFTVAAFVLLLLQVRVAPGMLVDSCCVVPSFILVSVCETVKTGSYVMTM